MHKNYILTRSAFPYGFASTNRIKCYAKALCKADVPCEVIIYQRNNIKENSVVSDVFEGVHFRYINGKSIRASNIYIARLFDLYDRISLCFFLLFHVKKGDAVFGYELIPFHFLLILIVHIKDAKYYAELCEYPYIDEDSKKSEWQKKICTWFILRCQFRLYDGIIAISDGLVELGKNYANPQCKIIKIPILIDSGRIQQIDRQIHNNGMYIFHSGKLTERKDGILGMIEAFGLALKQIRTPLKFYCTGEKDNSPYKDEIDSLIHKYHLQNSLFFTGYLSEPLLAEKISRASMAIINKYPTKQNKYCFATKLGEYMAWGIPIIITKVGEAVNWLHDGEDVVMVNPCEKEELASAIVRLINDDKLRDNLSRKAIETCQKSFVYENYSVILKDFFET